MLLGEANASHVAGDNNPSANYKRAVVRAPPSRFMVEFLPTTRTNGAYHHGMHVSSAITGDTASVSTRSSGVEYDIWRRWEDFLWFQDILEQEYTRAAREKKTRLQQGKGVKGFNGMYKQDMASSWESLPPGPDPNAVAQDIHAYLPTLPKKGTLFRASQATIDTRQKEITSLIETLFSDSMPALIQEIRESSVVTDFFALWRRDYDHMDRTPKYDRSSVSSSVFSSYFSESTSSLATRSSRSSKSSSSNSNDTINPRSHPPTPAKDYPVRPRVYINDRPGSISSSSDITETTHYPKSRRSSGGSVDTLEPMQPRRRRPVSSASSDSSMSAQSDGSSDSSSTGATSPSIVEEAPYVFGHNPQLSNDRPHSVLEVLPEERDMLSKTSECPAVLPRRPRASPSERRANRNTQVMCAPPPRPASRVRESWQTVTSMDARADQIMEGLGFSLPNPIKDNKFRQSMASISTFMTTDSADAVLRRDSSYNPDFNRPDGSIAGGADSDETRTLSSAPRSSTALTLSDFEIYSECAEEEEDVFSNGDTESMIDRRSFLDARSILEGFPRPNSYLPESYRSAIPERSETPTGYQYLQSLRIDSNPSTPFSTTSELPPSPTGTTFSDSTFNGPPSPTSTVFSSFTGYSAASSISTTSTTASSISPNSLSLKVAYDSTIILLRASREMSLAEVRQRLYNKFVGQEGLPLHREFGLAFAASAPLSPVRQRKRTVSAASNDSAGSGGSSGSGVTAAADLQPVRSEEEWRMIVSTFSGGKMSLRVTDPVA